MKKCPFEQLMVPVVRGSGFVAVSGFMSLDVLIWTFRNIRKFDIMELALNHQGIKMKFLILAVISCIIGFAVRYFIGNYLGVAILDIMIGFIAGGAFFVIGSLITLIFGNINV